jgi:nucleotidyltransferase/DNA polymerase involved in DNA repair
MNYCAHVDVNHFYAQIEALFRPELRGTAFIVGGDRESRKGMPGRRKHASQPETTLRSFGKLFITQNSLWLPYGHNKGGKE